jgi:hypothetical protein
VAKPALNSDSLVDPRTIYVAIDHTGYMRVLLETYAANDRTGLLIVSRFDAGVTIPAGLVVVSGLGPNWHRRYLGRRSGIFCGHVWIRGDARRVRSSAKIDGPILHDCGGRDLLIPSCPFGIAIENRLNAAHFPFAHQLLTYPDAGHLVNAGVPYDPIYVDSLGGTLEVNEIAVAKFWSQQLTFLAAIGP